MNSVCLAPQKTPSAFNTTKSLLEEIVKMANLSLAQIAQECRISPRELRRLLDDEIDTTSTNLFNKLLCFYCFLYCHQQGLKLKNTTIH